MDDTFSVIWRHTINLWPLPRVHSEAMGSASYYATFCGRRYYQCEREGWSNT